MPPASAVRFATTVLNPITRIHAYLLESVSWPPLFDVRHAPNFSYAVHAVLGLRAERRGRLPRAERHYRRALEAIDRERRSRKVFLTRREMQFRLESVRNRLGVSEVSDPLFEIDSRRPAGAKANGLRVQTKSYGVQLSGLVTDEAVESVELLVNGEPVRSTRLDTESRSSAPPTANGSARPRRFRFQLRRPVLARLPEESTVAVRAGTNAEQSKRELWVSGGDGSLFDLLRAGGGVDKKGYLTVPEESVRRRQEALLALYAEAREAFRDVTGRELFLMYGTLLGYVREGDFIPGDDDFDVGYLSAARTPREVRQESIEIMASLARAGFYINLNTMGRPFRLRRSTDAAEEHLDVHAVWHERGFIWAQIAACLSLGPESFVPCGEGELRGRKVAVPADAKAFLHAYYGPGWCVPDPGYTSTGKASRRVRRYLDRTCLNAGEAHDLREAIEQERGSDPSVGAIVTNGTHDLYPLDEYERSCGW